jgi:hypothetical protein
MEYSCIYTYFSNRDLDVIDMFAIMPKSTYERLKREVEKYVANDYTGGLIEVPVGRITIGVDVDGLLIDLGDREKVIDEVQARDMAALFESDLSKEMFFGSAHQILTPEFWEAKNAE